MKSWYLKIVVLSIIVLQFGCKKDERLIDNGANPESKAFGKIYCETYPAGAKIYIDSIYTGKSTPSLIDSLTEETHTVEFKKNYFSTFETSAQVRVNTIPALRCTLKQNVNTSTYFPLTVGSSWIYERTDTGRSKIVDTVSFTITNIDSSINIGVGSVWIEKYPNNEIYSLVAAINNDTLRFSLLSGISYTWRTFVFPLSMKKTWTIGRYDGYLVDTIETVVTKSGSFSNCYKVRQLSTISNTHDVIWYWIHDKYGIVKIYYADGVSYTSQVWNLVSYHIE